MTRLFWKIFLWFWGAMIVIGLGLYFIVLTSQPDPLPDAWQDGTTTALEAVGSSSAAAWERGGHGALVGTLNSSRQGSPNRYWLFDSQMRELSGQRLPDNLRPQRGGPRGPLSGLFGGRRGGGGGGGFGGPGGPGGRGGPRGPMGEDGPPPEEMDGPPDQQPGSGPLTNFPGPSQFMPRTAMRALRSTETQYALAVNAVVVSRQVRSSSGKVYVIAALMPRPDAVRTAAEPVVQLVGGLSILALSGLICFGLVRYITGPLIELRAATVRLASGDLAARTLAAQSKRRDEVVDIGRDFDVMAERIQTLVESQRQLLGDISHELRSPLARMRMALALSRRYAEQGVTGDELMQGLDRIGRETGRLDDLIGQLLDLTRLDSEQLGNGQPVQLDILLREIVTDAQFEARSQHRDVVLLRNAPCRLTGHKDLLQSAMENVIRNAIRYTREGSAIEVSLNVGSIAVIQVRDHGPGVPEAALTHLFTPFYRVEAARDRKSGGVGLGLAITERAVRAHGGQIIARNCPEGGLEITIHLPLSREAQHALAAPAAPAELPASERELSSLSK